MARGQSCSICTHPAIATLNASLTTPGVSVIGLARQHGVSRDLLYWHKRKHLSVLGAPNTVTSSSNTPHPHSPGDPHPPSLTPHDTRYKSSGSEAVRRASTARARERFLKSYALCGNITTAAKAAGIARMTVYQWQEASPEFVLAMRQADLQATEVLEREAWRRARDGVAESVYQHGKQVGTIQRYSDQLLMFLLRARAPERYRDRVDVSLTPTIKAVAGFVPADVL